MRERTRLKETIELHETQMARLDDAEVALELAEEDETLLEEAAELADSVTVAVEQMELQRMLGGGQRSQRRHPEHQRGRRRYGQPGLG
jgi:hypothetical protein